MTEQQHIEPDAERLVLAWQGAMVVAGFSMLVGGIAALQSEPYTASFSLVFGVLVGLFGLLVRRYGRSIDRVGHSLSAMLVLFLAISGYFFEGVRGGAPLVLPALAAMSFFLLGKSAWPWILALIAFNGLLASFPELLPPSLVQDKHNEIVLWSINSACAVGVFVVAQGFAKQEQSRREEALRAQALAERARAEAEAASHAKSVFLAAMSHELRTPLNAVVGAAQLLNDSKDAERDSLIQTIQQAGLSLAGQLEEVLDFSRIEAGELTLSPSPTDPAALMQQVRSVFSARAEAKGLRLLLDLPARELGWFLLDGDRARQVLLNLVGNAIKFTKVGHVRVSLRALAGPAIRFVVEDTGPGICPSARERIFEPFRQEEEGLQRSHGGIGLGLAISRGIAQAMGGSLLVQDSESGGCCFVFEVAAPHSQAAAVVLAAPASTQGLEVLLVEDNPTNRMIAQAMLRRIGCTVRLAENGRLGVAAVRERRPDLVLMDLQMPVMDGLRATRLIREFEAELPIVVLSANAFAQDRAAATAAGADDFLCKPVLQRELSLTVGRWSPAGRGAPVRG